MNTLDIDSILADAELYTHVHDNLNTAIFDNSGLMWSNVRDSIIHTVDCLLPEFTKYQIQVHDVVLVGSNATYVYNKNSDLDIHVVGDYSSLTADIINQTLKDFYDKNYIPGIAGHDLEIIMSHYRGYLAVSDGIFSLKNNQWVRRPTHDLVFDLGHLRHDLSYLISVYDQAMSCTDFGELKKKVFEFRNYVRQGLYQDGYTSSRHVALKILRNQGIVRAMYDYHDRIKSINTI